MSFNFQSFLANDIAIDLGTANTLVYVGVGAIIIKEPSLVAIVSVDQEILSYETGPKEVQCRTVAEITTVRPSKYGVISDLALA